MKHTTKHTQGTTCTCGIITTVIETGIGCYDENEIAECPLCKSAPAMYEALVETMRVLRSLRDNKEEWYTLVTPELLAAWDKNKAVLAQAEGKP